MSSRFDIVVTDCNRRVRQLLSRELAMEGYSVKEAGSDAELWRILDAEGEPDLIILDPDIPKLGAWRLISRLRMAHPALPMVVHSFVSDYASHPDLKGPTTFVEKRGSSIGQLKAVVAAVLLRRYPHRFSGASSGELKRWLNSRPLLEPTGLAPRSGRRGRGGDE